MAIALQCEPSLLIYNQLVFERGRWQLGKLDFLLLLQRLRRLGGESCHSFGGRLGNAQCLHLCRGLSLVPSSLHNSATQLPAFGAQFLQARRLFTQEIVV